MVKSVHICTNGECNGECYRCRLKAALAERDRYARLALDLMDRVNASGHFGPWSDGWTDEHQRLWEEAEELKRRFGVEKGAAA